MFRFHLRHLTTVCLTAVVLWLPACGGGDGPDDPPPAPEVTGRGELKSSDLVNTVPLADIVAAAEAGIDATVWQFRPRYAVTSYRLTYLTIDGRGAPVLASGLVSVPVKPAGTPSPVLSYQHGTIFKDAEAPSHKVVATEPPVLLASQGYIVVASDYVGFGASRGVAHPYLLAAPMAAAVIDLLTAAKTWRARQQVEDNGQLFLIGYSQGGHATLAAHRAMQEGRSEHLAQLRLTVPGAGPYDVGLTLDSLLERVRAENPLLAGLINPGLLRDLGPAVRNEVRRLMLRAAIPEDADVAIQSTFLDHYLADDVAAMERDSNVRRWAPALPVRLFHGQDDQTVPYVVASETRATMHALGAASARLADCSARPASHLGCVQPYFAYALEELSHVARDL